MYLDKKTDRSWPLVLGLILVLALVTLLACGSRMESRDLRDEGAAAIQSAIERGALQCYAVEGVYPPTLEYLEENYGLKVNTRDFYIRYDIFASNIAPEITVTGK